MIGRKNLLNIVCTEAVEHSGVPEIPENKHGAWQNYSTGKRDARGSVGMDVVTHVNDPEPLIYRLEVIRHDDGTLSWEE